jgi:hypothetical protein
VRRGIRRHQELPQSTHGVLLEPGEILRRGFGRRFRVGPDLRERRASECSCEEQQRRRASRPSHRGMPGACHAYFILSISPGFQLPSSAGWVGA